MAMDTVVVEILLFYYVPWSRQTKIQGAYDFMDENPS